MPKHTLTKNSWSHWLGLKSAANSFAKSCDETMRLDVARYVCHVIAASYWKEKVSQSGNDLPVASSDIVARPNMVMPSFVEKTVSLLAKASVMEAAYKIGTMYTAMLPDALRTKDGVFYTPVPYVEHLVNSVEFAGVDWKTANILDPAAGCGMFMIGVLTHILNSLKTSDSNTRLNHVATHLRGIELDPFSAWLGHVFLELSMLNDITKANQRLPRLITVGDTFEQNIEARFDLVIGNPPYGKVKLSDNMRQRFARSLYGHANLYGLFMDLAVAATKANGIIGLVTPTSFLGGQYFKNLRNLLEEQAPPVSIDFINERVGVFDDVLQETVLTVCKKGSQPVAVEVRSVTTIDEQSCLATSLGSIGLKPGYPWFLPRAEEQAQVIKSLPGLTTRLCDLKYEVVTGQLVWNRHKQWLSNNKTTAQSHPIIWAESLSEKGFLLSNTRKNHAAYIELTHGQDYLLTKDPCILVQRTTSKEQNRRLVSGVLPQTFLDCYGPVVVENHLNLIRKTAATPISPEFLSFLLNSKAVDVMFRCISGSVAVSAYELENLRFPTMASLLKLQNVWSEGKGQLEAGQKLLEIYGFNTCS